MRISDWISDVCSSDLGLWSVGSIPAGVTRTLTISGTVTATAGASVTNSAEISASSAFDYDSTPGNGAAGEDDQDSATFTVSGTRVAGTPPTLVCRSEEHTSELQSLMRIWYAVFCSKKKTYTNQ